MIDRYDIHKISFDDLQHELESGELVLVSEDDLSCMEDDYKEACDRLITCGTIAKEGLAATDIDNKSAFGIDDITMAHSKFDEILTEVES